MNRCAVSIPSNIAEDRGRGNTKDYIRFLTIAKASSMEQDTQLFAAEKPDYIPDEEYKKIEFKIKSILMIINKLMTSLKSKI